MAEFGLPVYARRDLVTFHCCRFLIGREKDGMESEVARLINESLEKEKITEMVFCCLF